MDGKTRIKLLKFTLIAPYLPPLFYKKTRLCVGDSLRSSKDAKYSTDYSITYLCESQIKKSYEITS